MLAVAAFWVLLCLPGYAVLRRFLPGALAGTGLGTIALSYLASFALLTPISLVGYVFHLPLVVLSTSVVFAVLGALVWVGRDLARSWRRPQLSIVALICSVILAADLIVALRVGSYFVGDAKYHIARVRMLLAFGFNNWDPFASVKSFDPVYNTNLYHALIAAAAQLAHLDAFQAWVHTRFWFHLMLAACTAHLAYAVLGERWIAWIAGTACAICFADDITVTYPNSLCAFALIPLGLAFAVEAWAGGNGIRPAVFLAAISAVLVQVHALYLVFLCMLAAPALCLRLLLSLRSTMAPIGRRELIFSLLALGVGTPWFADRVWHALESRASAQVAPASAPPSSNPGAATEGTDEPAWSYRGFRRLDGNRIMLEPALLVDPHSQFPELLLALALGVMTRRRAQFAAMAALSVPILMLFIPFVCSALQRAAGAAWIVHRLAAIPTGMGLALFPGVALLLFHERISAAAARVVALCLGLLPSVVWGAPAAQTFSRYLAIARSPAKTRRQVEEHASMRAWFNANIERGSVVAVPLTAFFVLTTDCDCYPLALPRHKPSHGVVDMDQRRGDTHQLFAPTTSLRHRLKLMRKYGLRQLFLPRHMKADGMLESFQPVTEKLVEFNGNRILTIDPNNGKRRKSSPQAVEN